MSPWEKETYLGSTNGYSRINLPDSKFHFFFHITFFPLIMLSTTLVYRLQLQQWETVSQVYDNTRRTNKRPFSSNIPFLKMSFCKSKEYQYCYPQGICFLCKLLVATTIVLRQSALTDKSAVRLSMTSVWVLTIAQGETCGHSTPGASSHKDSYFSLFFHECVLRMRSLIERFMCSP